MTGWQADHLHLVSLSSGFVVFGEAPTQQATPRLGPPAEYAFGKLSKQQLRGPSALVVANAE